MTPTRYAEACERAEDMEHKAACLFFPPNGTPCNCGRDEAVALLRALAQALREGVDVAQGKHMLAVTITLPTETT